MTATNPATETLKLGISACLLGNEVRYNGGHKQSNLCSRVLSEHFEFIPVCPEVAIGLGTPREPIRLIGDPAAPRAVGTIHREIDVTDAPTPGGSHGIFAKAFCARHPDLPVEEDGRLNDAVLRDNFLTRVYAYARWQQLLHSGLTRQSILDFHSRYKYQLLATDPVQYKALGQLLGNLSQYTLPELAPRYFSQLMQALKKCATRRTHSNVLQHLCGYLKKALSGADKQEISQLIELYRNGIVPLVVPLTLLKHHLRHHPDAYIARQVYLQPHPENLSLRNAL